MAAAPAGVGLEACKAFLGEAGVANAEEIVDSFASVFMLIATRENAIYLYEAVNVLMNGDAPINDPHIMFFTGHLAEAENLIVQMVDWNAGKAAGKGAGKSESRPTPCLGSRNRFTGEFHIVEVTVGTIISLRYAAKHRGSPINEYTGQKRSSLIHALVDRPLLWHIFMSALNRSEPNLASQLSHNLKELWVTTGQLLTPLSLLKKTKYSRSDLFLGDGGTGALRFRVSTTNPAEIADVRMSLKVLEYRMVTGHAVPDYFDQAVAEMEGFVSNAQSGANRIPSQMSGPISTAMGASTMMKAKTWLTASGQFTAEEANDIFALSCSFTEDGSGFSDQMKQKIFRASAGNPAARPAAPGGARVNAEASAGTEDLLNEVDAILSQIH